MNRRGQKHTSFGFSFWLALHFYNSKSGNRKGASLSIALCTLGVSLGLAVMLVSVGIVKGFQGEMASKMSGWVGHLSLSNDCVSDPSVEPSIVVTDTLMSLISDNSGVAHVQRVSQKIGILKVEDAYQSVCLKGVAQDFDASFMKEHLIDGVLPDFTDSLSTGKVVISDKQRKMLGLNLGDEVYAYFFTDNIKTRKFEVAGIYNTYLSQFDDGVVLTDMYTVNRLNGWGPSSCSRIEIYSKEFNGMTDLYFELAPSVNALALKTGKNYALQSIKENPLTSAAFSWLEVLNLNVVAILVLMLGVAAVTMVSGLLILILGHTQTIGILKAMGATNSSLRRAFVSYAMLIVGKGMLLGNAVGFAIMGLQSFFGWVKLNPETYYLEEVPIGFDWGWIVGINLFTAIGCLLSLLLPSFFVSRIEPARSIKFE